jgi:hypothetical protein
MTTIGVPFNVVPVNASSGYAAEKSARAAAAAAITSQDLTFIAPPLSLQTFRSLRFHAINPNIVHA